MSTASRTSPSFGFAARLLLSALSGTLLFLACATFDVWPLAWFGLFPLLVVLLDRDGMPRAQRGSPFLYGFVCGLLGNGGGFYWINGLLIRFGHMPFAAAAPIFLLLVAYQALTFAFFASLLCRLRAQVDVPVTWLAALCWTACELCVPYVFPFYLAITQAWLPPVIQVADFAGPLGVSFLLVLSSGALFDLYCLWRRGGPFTLRTAQAPLLAALTVLLALAYGGYRIHEVQARRARADKIKIGVVQANIGINEKFVPGLAEQQLRIHQHESAELERRGAELIVWPESSYPYPILRPVLADFPPADPRRVRRGLARPLLFGALTVERQGSDFGRRVPYNTALLMDEHGEVRGSFDKNFLLVFGEYVPYANQMEWLRRLVPEISNFARGTATTTFPLQHRGKGYGLGPMICYEDIIPAFGRRLFDAPRPPNLLVNITNDAWFGATSEPYEHLALSVFRAVEHRVDLVRAVNTGVSAFVDATGKVYDRSRSVDPVLTPGVPPAALLNEAALLQPAGLYQRLGDAFGGACLLLVLGLGVLARRRAGRPVRWRWILGGAAALHGAVLLAALLSPGSSFRTVYAVLFHRDEHVLPEAETLHAGLVLVPVLVLASAALGAVLRRLGARASIGGAEAAIGIPAGRLESLGAIVCVTVLPVVLWGRMEGNTGPVVLLSLLCAGASVLLGRLGR